jgi:hypothetical protein
LRPHLRAERVELRRSSADGIESVIRYLYEGDR